jgi:uncharacterized protein (DUF305 family)
MVLKSCLTLAAFLFSLATAWSQQAATSGSVSIVQPGAPGQSSKALSAATAIVPVREPSEADTSFMQGMIHHHSQAVEMTALIPTHTHNKRVLELGMRISISQTDEIKSMQTWLEDHGKAVPMDHSKMDHGKMAAMHGPTMAMKMMDMKSMLAMPGMLTAEQMQALAKAAGPAFDRLFLTGMIQHHTGALVMVQELFDTPGAGQDSQLFDFATDVDNTQRAEIEIMKGLLNGKH